MTDGSSSDPRTDDSRPAWELKRDEIRFDTCAELFTALIDRGSPHLLYRGQREFDWQLTCTLSRALRAQAKAGGPIPLDLMESMVDDEGWNRHVERVETGLLRSFMDRAQSFAVPGLPEVHDRLGWWELMQHHGAPTRLLDWTRSPFIALWFAVQEATSAENDAALWIFDSRNSWINHLDTMGAAQTHDWGDFPDDRALQNRLAEVAIREHKMVPLIMTPRVSVARAVAQQSVLTLVPNVEVPRGFAHAVFSSVATKVRVPSAWKPEILAACEGLGLTRVELFRDFDSLGAAMTSALNENRPITIVDVLREAMPRHDSNPSG